MLLSFDNFLQIYESKTENKKESPKYEYGCVMLMLDIDDNEWSEIISIIEDEDIYDNEDGDYGKENEPHITLLFGLKPDQVSLDQIKQVVDQYEMPSIKLNKVSSFDNEDYDVIKFEISDNSGILTQINSELSEFPNENKYPDYNPHVTIAYCKSGTSHKYNGEVENPSTIEPSHVMYSQPDEEYQDLKKDKIDISKSEDKIS